jgi:homocitrate synthase NifV
MGPAEIESIKAIKQSTGSTRVSAWNRVRIDDVLASLKSGVDVAHLCAPIRESHLVKKLGQSWATLSQELKACLDLVRGAGLLASVGLEDVSRASSDELVRAADLLDSLNVKLVRLSDTVGVLTPSRTKSLVSYFKGRGFTVEFHGHNDLGLAYANSLIAALSGAELLDVTVAGVGERAGNCSLAKLIALGASWLDFDVSLESALELEAETEALFNRRAYILDLLNAKTAVETFLKNDARSV